MNERVKIDAIRVRELRLPLRTPFRISGGVLLERRSWIVEIDSDGVVGYGESAPNDEPFYSEETLGTARTLFEELYLPRLIGREFESINAFDEELRRGVRGNPFARVGLENAYWDLCCRRSGVSLVEAINRRLESLGVDAAARTPAPSIDSGVAVGIPEDGRLDTLRRRVEEYLEEGYRRVKIKIRPDWSTEACRVVRRAAGDGFPFWTDANAAFFDAANGFKGCIAGIHEVLRRQGLLEGIWCLNEAERLSPGQAAEIDRVYAAYPHLNDDAFVERHRDEWLR